MNIQITVEAPGLVQALESLAAALANQPITLPVVDGKKLVEQERNIATKVMYFIHSESDSLFTVKKGEELPQIELVEEITKEEFNRLQALKETAKEDIPQEKEETVSVITLVTVRAHLQKLQEAGMQKDAKAILTDLGRKKLSDVPEEDYQTILDKVEELLA